jgi:nitrite reductase (NO-forming)
MRRLSWLRFGVLVIAATAVLTACGSTDMPRAAAPSAPAASGPVLGTLEFTGFEMAFEPSTVEVAQPGRYAVVFTNTGHTDHDWAADGVRIVASPGATARGKIMVPAEGLEFVCSFPGHASAGMRGTITVASAANAQP